MTGERPVADPTPVDLRLVSAFVAVAREGSVTRAAASLGYSQPAVTHQLQELERRLGCVLIERRRVPLQLTPAGRERLAVAEAMLLLADSLVPPRQLSRRHEG